MNKDLLKIVANCKKKQLPLMIIKDERSIKTIYKNRSSIISFDRSKYIDCLMVAIDRCISLTGKKATIVKI